MQNSTNQKQQTMTKMLAPVVLFVYNRPWHTQKTVEALQKNELANRSDLIIYSDAPKNEQACQQVNDVRAYLKTIEGFKSVKVIERDKNWGLANSIIDGVTKTINEYEKVIVLEDDLVVSLSFLKYMNDALSLYEHNESIGSITGFNFSTDLTKFQKNNSVFLNIRPMSWTWATWKSVWCDIEWNIENYNALKKDKKFIKKLSTGGSDLPQMLDDQMNGKVNSWYVRFTKSLILSNQYTVYPIVSLVNNLGHDGTGVHCGDSVNSVFSHQQLSNEPVHLEEALMLDISKVKSFNRGFNRKWHYHKILLKTLFGERLYEYIKKSVKHLVKKYR